MQQNRIKYFSYHGIDNGVQKRDNSPAADTKVDYIIDVLNRIGYSVDHISPAPSATSHFQPSYVEQRGQNTFRWYASFGKTKSPLRVFNRWFLELQFFLWCLFNIKKGEQVIIYHSLGYDSTFLKLKKLKHIRIIGDIEEIYQDVSKQKSSQESNEFKFIDACDKYIFVNSLLNERLNTPSKPLKPLNSQTLKPFIVLYGLYNVNEYAPVSYNDGKIHVLYAGTYDPNKGGALASVKAAEFLDDRYHLHITGFGSKALEEGVRQEVERVRPLTKCQITFHGYLDDAQFLDLMHHCTIGLCTQNPTSKLNLTSFPSKILNYMANGLVVLSGRNRAIEESAVADLLYYYDEQEPKAMAEAIMSIQNPDGEKGKQRLRELDKQFENELIKIIQ